LALFPTSSTVSNPKLVAEGKVHKCIMLAEVMS
jgi:hypothetical protein